MAPERLSPRHLDSLAPASRGLLAALAGRPWAADFYLAGSSALAQLAIRRAKWPVSHSPRRSTSA